MVAAQPRAAVGLQIGLHTGRPDAARPRKTREQRRRERAERRHGQHARIEPDVGGERKRLWRSRYERPGERVRERDAGGPGESEEGEAFGPELPDQPSARGADGGPDPELQGARVRLCEQQVRDVGARDGQQHRDHPASNHISGRTGPTMAS